MNTLHVRMRQLLAQASVIAEAKSQKLEGKTSHGKAEAVGPQSAGTPVYDELLRILSTPLSEAKLERAERVVQNAKVQRKVSLPDYLRVLQFEGEKADAVAVVLCCSERTVRRWRAAAGVDGTWGRQKAA